MSVARSPYIPCAGPVYDVQLFHSTRRAIVTHCVDYGLVGAPYPLRFVLCPSATHGHFQQEKGWIDNGMFVPDPNAVVPRRHQVSLADSSVRGAPGLEIGDPQSDEFPKRAVLLFRYDAMDIGIDRSQYTGNGGGPGGEFVRHASIPLDTPFGGLGEADLDFQAGRNKPLSLAAHQAADLAAVYISKL